MRAPDPIRQITKDTFFYGLGGAVQRLMMFLLFPLYARLLTQADFGAQDLIATAMMIATQFIVLGLDSGAARYFYDAQNSREQEEILSTWLWFSLLLSVPICLVLIFVADAICVFVFREPTLISVLRLGIATLPFSLVASVGMMTLRMTFQSKSYSLVCVLGVILQGLSSLYLIAVLRLGLMGVFLAGMLVSLFQATLGIAFTHHHYRWVLSRRWLKGMLTFGLPMVIAGLSLWVLNYSNRYFLVRFGSLNDIGLLSVAGRVASVLTFLVSAFQIAWGPFAYSLIKDVEVAKKTYSRILTYFLLCSLTGSVGLAIFGREVILFLATPAYEPATPLVPWLCAGIVAWGAFYIVGMGYGIARKNYHTMILTLLAATVSAGLNFLLIPRWGILGAAIGTALGNFVALAYGYVAGQHYFSVHYEGRRIAGLVAIATITMVIGALIDRAQATWSLDVLFYKSALYLGFLLGLLGLKIVTQEEWNSLRSYLKRYFVWTKQNRDLEDGVAATLHRMRGKD
jgi:O-antigen/teichoic acid export membrane protein